MKIRPWIATALWLVTACGDSTATESTGSSSGTTNGSTTTMSVADDGSTSAVAATTTSSGAVDSSGSSESSGGDTGVDVDPGAPDYDDVDVVTVELPGLGDPADIYVPVPGDGPWPVALVLQGANVDKAHYSEFASLVARYGFIVVVPNHESTGVTGTGLFMEQSVIVDALDAMATLSADGSSELAGLVDESAAGLLGHSYGGVVGVYALTDQCTFPFCTGEFVLPPAVTAGVFYGTNMRPPFGGPIPVLPNAGRGIGLVQGTEDSKALPVDANETYAQVQTPPAALVTLLGANHYGLNDTDNPPGADPDPVLPTLDQDVSIETSARLSALLLRAWVLEDAEAAEYLSTLVDRNALIQQTG